MGYEDINKNKSESPEPFRYNNYYHQNSNYINYNNKTNIHPMMFNNKLNQNCNNCIKNNPHSIINYNNSNKKEENYNAINNTNINQINNINYNTNNNLNIMNPNTLNNMNNLGNMNLIKNINYFTNSHHNSNHNINLNMSYNFSPNPHNIINDSIEDLYNASGKRENSFNSCPSLRGNHLSFNTTTDTNNNINYQNNNKNNLLLNHNDNQNLLFMQKLFLNLNPYTASLMRNNDANMNNILINYNTNLNNNTNNYFNNVNNYHFNHFKQMESFNINNSINEHHKKSHSTKEFHIYNGNFGFNMNNFNNSIDGNMSNDNLSYSSIGSNKAQMKKKRTSLFQNGCNKEKDLRDFKRFCDGLKIPMQDYICNQIGSRIMQKYLKRFPSFIRTLLINKLSIYFEKIMCDTYGNYFCQKLYNISELEQRIIILNCLKDYFINISKNNSGAHATQFIIGASQSEEERKIILKYISNHEIELAFDPEGTHVLQKIITCFPENEIQNLIDVLFNNFNSLCKDSKGICVIKKLVSNIKNKINENKLFDNICKHCIEIAQNPFGNYIIQYILEECTVKTCHKLIEICITNSILFATQKYSSNIIGKIIDLFSNNIEFNFVQQISHIFFDYKNISDLYNNKYGKLLLFKLSKLKTKEEKYQIIEKFEKGNDEHNKKENIQILNELFN